MNNSPARGSESRPPFGGTGAAFASDAQKPTMHTDVLALLPDPAFARECLDIAEDAARAVQGTMAAARVGADPEGMIAAAEEIDLQMLRDMTEGSPLQRSERIMHVFQDWRQDNPDRKDVLLDDCHGDLDRCVTVECHATALVVTPRHGNMDARDALHDILFKEHKLVLVPAPGPYAGNLLGHVVIGWKPNEHAQRAVVAARRWLAAADRTTMLCVNDRADGSYQSTARELLTQLGLGGDVVAISSGSRSVGETILDFAKSADATCLLIGAFKHGYFLELLLGRVTRYLMSHSTLPMMMKH